MVVITAAAALLPALSINMTTVELLRHHLLVSLTAAPPHRSAHSGLTNGQLGSICSVMDALGSAFSPKHNMAKQIDCSEISRDSGVYIIEQAVMPPLAYTYTDVHLS